MFYGTKRVATSSNSVLLQTASVNVKISKVRVLFDSCSQMSYITPSLATKLNLKPVAAHTVSIKTFGNHVSQEVLNKVNVCFITSEGEDILINCFAKDICAPLTGQQFTHKNDYDHLKNLDLADSYNSGHVPIDILIGADSYWKFMENNIITGNSGPVAIKSKFGFVLSGNIGPVSNDCSVMVSHVLKCQAEILADNRVNQFWDIENMGFNSDEKVAVNAFHDTINFKKCNKRYEVHLPFKEDDSLISDNYTLCVKRFSQLRNKLKKDQNLFDNYSEILKEQLEHNIIEPVSTFDNPVGELHYLPHRPVIKQDKETTKVRVVFDVSAKSYGPTLNDCLLPGPSLTSPLFGVLLRFRAKIYAFISDIEKAFLQIELNEKHRDFVRFLWFKDLNVSLQDMDSAELSIYRLCRVLFGVTSSSFLLTATLITHAEKYRLADPVFVENLLRSLHVEDLISGANSLSEVLGFFLKCKQHLAEASFNLRKFESNSQQLAVDGNNHVFITKVLGLVWNKDTDDLLFSFTNIAQSVKDTPTKREVLQFLASLFDPLGLLNPVIVKVKILFQLICIQHIRWDKKIDGELLEVWKLIIQDLGTHVIAIPRLYVSGLHSVISYELIGFSDASVKAYGCCIYLKVVYNDGTYRSALVTAKSRVAPIKPLTIPKLELSAALLLANLLKQVLSELQLVYEINGVKCYIDSTICLHWRKGSEKNFIPFIQRRVINIRSNINPDHWYYVESFRNPADIVSHGSYLHSLIDNSLWLSGPDFIHDNNANMPVFDIRISNDISDNDVVVLSSTAEDIAINLEVINIDRYNDYRKLIRVTALVLRLKVKHKDIVMGLLMPQEICSAESLWFRYIQIPLKSYKSYSQLKKDLNFVYVNGIIRCQGAHDECTYSI